MGKAPFFRCPWKAIVPNYGKAVHYLHSAKEYGLLPVKGAMLDQSAAFNKALQVFCQESAKIENLQQEKAMKKGQKKMPNTSGLSKGGLGGHSKRL